MSSGQAHSQQQTIRTGIRSFVAVPLSAPVRSAILAAAEGLSARLPEVKWTRKAENLHVTLMFLGQVEPSLLARFGEALGGALGPHPSFTVDVRGVGAFPSLKNAQVVWVGVEDPSQQLAEIARAVVDVAEQLAVCDVAEQRRRPFRAHITIGRTPRRFSSSARQAHRAGDVTAALAPWAERAFGQVLVNEVHLYESITGGDASTYVLRGTAALEGATHGDRKERDQGIN
jgi:RNA 2',3'-cyclic 3'-phosphodiesterase